MSNTANGFLGAARQALVRRFVGREATLTSLEASLAEALREPRLVHLTGPAGIGKTALLTVFAERVSGRARLHWLAAGALAPDEARRASALGVPSEQLGRGPLPDVLVLDALEKDPGLVDWLLETALPRAGSQVLVLTASREALGPPGPVRAALAPITRELKLRPLSLGETMEALARRGVPERQRAELAPMAAGLPRAIVELAEKSRIDRPTPLAERPPNELIDAVAATVIRDVPSALHRRAIEALSVALALDEPLLRAMMGTPVPEAELRALYEWLGALTFVTHEPRGLVLHALVRNAVDRDLSARDPVLRRELGRRAATELVERADGVGLAIRHHIVVEALFAQRDVLVAGPPAVALFEGARRDRLRRATSKDAASIQAWTASAPAPLAERVLEAWAREPASLLVAGPAGGPPSAAALACLASAFGELAAVSAERDRRALVLWQPPTDGPAPLSASHLAVLLGASLVMLEEQTATELLLISAPAELEELADDLALSPLHRPGVGLGHQLFELDVSALTGGQLGAQGVLEIVRRLALEVPPTPRDDEPEPPIEPRPAAPGEPLRGEWVRRALAARHRPHELKRSPLLALGIVRERVGPLCTPEQALAATLDEACRALAAAPAYVDAARLLEVTYLDPTTVKQEAAAAELGLPFGTYRYQLRRALALVTEELSARERRAR